MRARYAAVVALGLLGVAGCGRKREASVESPPLPAHALPGQITSRPCVYRRNAAEFRAVCGYLIVPENRTRLGLWLIALPYQRILARTRTPAEPLFALNGGPGQSNLSPAFPVSWFIGERDVVLLGYRGVDGSIRLDCPEVERVLRHGRAFLERPAMLALGAAYRRCATRLDSAGIDLAGYTILEVVDDVEALRRALGYDRIVLHAISYGTRVALIYGWRYPDRVARSAMIGVNPPGAFSFDPALLDRQLRRYAALCATDAYCSGRTRDLAADMQRALDRMPGRWLGFPIDRDAVLVATFAGLFSTSAAGPTFDMWLAAAHGDYSGMALVTAIYPLLLPRGLVWGDHAAKAYSADFERATVCAPELRPGRYLLGSPLNVIPCAAMGSWPEHRIPDEYRSARPSTVETLMLSGTLDVSTPAEQARAQLLPLMPNAHQVTVAEFAHAGDLLYGQPAATQQLLTAFYRTGRVDASRYRYRPVRFEPGWLRFGLIAKAVVAVVSLLAGTLLWLAIRWLRRHARRRRRRAPGEPGPALG
jgi:pimeloyl-ACP methyl ester carboxylesterase